ncbi:lysozyme inhibitor LprI family protein [Lacrimispora algidixylanolytica]|uniref:Lysozyme inhibitor LprI-like N-terminal domain-containing protein n=1 Tax=Lacrimispora algidixylanolytica TaxID=94868 RepID=A0A419SSP5_9FIRM|nr:lysozyme inhibitor LprI family protein [Lacrimispora algidixylanolytica]RKD28246.1 hypothetical protein BET01_12005 [Lacrimispora algidixylanolytica]
MNKGRGIWIVIGSILVIGVLITIATTSFINSKKIIPDPVGIQSFSSSEVSSDQDNGMYYNKGQEMYSGDQKKSKEQTSIPEEGASLKKAARAEGKSDESTNKRVVAEAGPEERMGIASDSADAVMAPPAAESIQETIISPINPDLKAKSSIEPASENGAASYQKHLVSLDEQIKKIREESGDSNTYSMKALADKELKLWNMEQNTIYDTVAQAISDEERKSLEVSQQNWVKTRDSKAVDAAKKFSGGSLEGLEYTASLAESTRERTYELVKEYSDVLPSSKNQ